MPRQFVYPHIRRLRKQRLQKSFAHFIGQQEAIVRVKAAINTFFEEGKPFNLLLAGPRSAGKTSISKATAGALDIPFIDTDANVLSSADSIAAVILERLVRQHIDIPTNAQQRLFTLPPLLFFVDEVQELSKQAQGSLLRATERSDAMLMTKSGNIFNCTNVIWAAATTNPEALVDTLVSRFRVVECRDYTVEEVVEMVANAYPKWSLEVCLRIVYYAGTFPRVAKAFAEQVYDLAKFERRSLPDTVERLARMSHIDEWGMHTKTRQILSMLHAHPEGMIQREIAQALGVDGKAVVKNYLPSLMRATTSHPSLVVHDERYYITAEGEAYLETPWPLNVE